jgi:colicin import membrane protein
MPAKAAKVPIRPKRTKTEIQREFDEIQEQSADARESADPKIEEASRRHETEVREAVDGVTVESAVQRISGLGLEISKALSGLSGKLTEEVQLLASVREAVGLERNELERLHRIDVAATALDQLVQDYARQKQELETEIAARRAAWEEEAARVDRERKEQEEALRKQRQREGEDFEYRKTQERKKAQDKYDEEIRLQEKKNQEKQDTLEKSWQLREAALKEGEEELARLRKESEGFPKRLEAEANAAAERARRESEARLQQEILVVKKDAEAEKRFGELRVNTLEETVAHLQAQIAALEKQLADAKQQVQDIAVKAIEGASGARALSHINQIAMEQAKNRPQG